MSASIGEVYVERDVFAPDLHEGLLDVAYSQSERKQRFDLPDGPIQVVQAAEHVASLLKISINTAIIKRYKVGEESGAYEKHPDPSVFDGNLIGLCTLDGEAMFFVETSDGVEEIECYNNTLVAIDPIRQHWVTPPLNPSGIRHILFFGFDQSRADTI